jgi:elongation factor Ts
MSNKDLLDNIKKLRELTGVGFKDCKLALDESNGDIEKSIEFLRKKGIAKASKKMSRTASEGLALVEEQKGEISVIEINSETDFVAKNKDFISFCKELSQICFQEKGDLEKINNSKMKNGTLVNENLVSLIAKIGEKITIRRTNFFTNKDGMNFYYVHSAIEKNIGKIVSVVKIDGIIKGKNEDIGSKISMHIAASNPMAIDKEGIKKELIDKELEIIKAEITNSGKPAEMAEKISKGKIAKFINDNTLLNQIWIMDPKKKVSDILRENKDNKEIKIIDFIRYKVGEGV